MHTVLVKASRVAVLKKVIVYAKNQSLKLLAKTNLLVKYNH